MESRAKIFGHAIHPILIVFPLGLFATAVIFDAIGWVTGNGRWLEISFWMIAAGIIGGLAAALFGLIDWLAIPSGTRAKAIGTWHGLGNVAVMLLFVASWLLRWPNPPNPGAFPVMLSLAGPSPAPGAGWLGGGRVERGGLRVGGRAQRDGADQRSGRPHR